MRGKGGWSQESSISSPVIQSPDVASCSTLSRTVSKVSLGETIYRQLVCLSISNTIVHFICKLIQPRESKGEQKAAAPSCESLLCGGCGQSRVIAVLAEVKGTIYLLRHAGLHTYRSTQYHCHMSQGQTDAPAASPTFSYFPGSSLPLPSQFLELGLALSSSSYSFIAIMLSTLRVASRSAAARDANMRTVVIGARHASAWSKVPQGPPVSLKLIFVRAECNCSGQC